jgi:hypothetical protein
MTLNEQQLKAIEMLADGRKPKEIAPVVDVTLATIYNWLKNSEFEKAQHDAVIASLRGGIQPLLKNLENIALDKKASWDSRVKASDSLLDRAGYKSIDQQEITLRNIPTEIIIGNTESDTDTSQ